MASGLRSWTGRAIAPRGVAWALLLLLGLGWMTARLQAETLTVISSSVTTAISANGEASFTQTAQLPSGAVVDKVTMSVQYSTYWTSTATAANEVVLNGTTLYSLNWVSGGTGNTWVSAAREVAGLPAAYSTSGGNVWKIRSLYNPSNIRNLIIQIQFRRTLTVAGLSVPSRTYDGTVVATVQGTPSLQGVVAGDTVSLSGTPTGTFANKNVGTGKSVSVSGVTLTGASAANYVVQLPTLTASITAKALTVTGLTAASKVYDGTDTATVSGTPVLSGAVTGDTVSLLGTANPSFNSSSVGPRIVTVSGFSLGGASAGNYTLTKPTLAANITAKALTIGAPTVTLSKVYDGTLTAAVTAGALSGVVAGDELSVTPSGSYNTELVGTGKTVTVTYALVGGVAHNYTAPGSQTFTTGVITAKGLFVSGLTAASRAYDGTTTATVSGTPALSGVVAGDTVSVLGTATGAFASKTVGWQRTVTVSGLSLSGASAGNYTLLAKFLEADITAKALTVGTATVTLSKVYDGTLAAAATAGALSGVVSGDVVSVTASGSYGTASVGTGKTVTVTHALGGTDAGNYTAPGAQTFTTGAITAKGLTVSGLTAASRAYDGTTLATVIGTAVLSGVVSGDTVSVLGTATGAFASKDVGAGKTVTAAGLSLGGGSAGNYTLMAPVLSANITPRALSLGDSSPVLTKVYDGTTTATVLGQSLDGVLQGDVVSVTADASFDTASVGTGKTVTVTLALGGADAGNYTAPGVQTFATGEITSRGLTVSGLAAASRMYDGTTAASISGAPALVGVVGADVVTVGGTATGSFADKNVGVGKAVTVAGLTLGGDAAGNYTLAALTLTADIMAKALGVGEPTVTLSKVYDGTRTAGATAGSLTGVVDGDAVSVTASGLYDTASVGTSKTVTVTYALAGTGAGNYTVPADQTFETGEITTKTLAVSGLAAASRVYDGTTTATVSGTPVLLDVVGDDEVAVAGTASGSFSDKNVGVGKTVTVAGLSLVGASAENYTLGMLTLIADVTRAPLRIVADDKRKSYDGTAFEGFTVRFQGLRGGDTAAVVSGEATFGGAAVSAVSVGSYAIEVVVTGMSSLNYSPEGVAGVLEIVLADVGFAIMGGTQGVGLSQASDSTGRFVLGATVGQSLAGKISSETGWLILAGFWYVEVGSAASLQGLDRVPEDGVAAGGDESEDGPSIRRLDYGRDAGTRMALPTSDVLIAMEPAGLGAEVGQPSLRVLGTQDDGRLRMEAAGVAGSVWLIQVRTELLVGEWRTVGWIQLGRSGTGWVDVAPMDDDGAAMFRLVHVAH